MERATSASAGSGGLRARAVKDRVGAADAASTRTGDVAPTARTRTKKTKAGATTAVKRKNPADSAHEEYLRGRIFPGVAATALVIAAAWSAFALRRRTLSPPEPMPPSSIPEAIFDEGEAQNHLRFIGGKPRWVGAKHLDRSLDYIVGKLEEMKGNAASNDLSLEVERFTTSGVMATSVGGLHEVASYSDVASVAVRLAPAGYSAPASAARDSLLVNTHVDSAWGSAGASDGAVGVAAALESVSALASTPPAERRLVRPVVFLFNGAKKPALAGSHGFVATHRWAATIAAHVNLEALGAGIAHMLFNAGPGHPWLVHAYARAVRRPWASASGTDVYEGGVVPAESDFRVFEEAGIPGLDFAMLDNGYAYQTASDDVKRVEKGSVLYAGQELLLPLVMELAGPGDAIGMNLLDRRVEDSFARKIVSTLKGVVGHIPSLRSEKIRGQERAVWFDVAGQVMVVYPEYVHTLVLLCLVVLALVVWISPLFGRTEREAAGVSYSDLMEIKARMIMCTVAAIYAGMASSSAIAHAYVWVLERPLPWFTSARFALAVFVPPTLIGVTLGLQVALPENKAAVNHVAMLHSCALFYAVLAFSLNVAGFLSSFVPTVVLAFFLVACCLPGTSQFIVFARLLIIFAPTALVAAGSSIDMLRTFLPVLGRSGDIPADVVAAALVSAQTLMYGIVPLLPVYAFYRGSIRRVRRHAVVLAAFMWWLVYMLPELTLPHRDAVYTKDGPKRILAYHFHSPSQNPQNVLALGSLDPIKVDVNTTVRMFPFSDKDASMTLPAWSKSGSTLAESIPPYLKSVSSWSVFRVAEGVKLPVPTASVEKEVTDDDGNAVVYISLSAPEAMQVSVRIPLVGPRKAVRTCSLADPMVDLGDGKGMWVRHFGGETGATMMKFSVTVPWNTVKGSRPPVVFDVTSSRPGVSRSAYLPRLYFPQWASPVYIQATGVSFSL